MAKRSNPYIDDFLPQYKVHVGLKEICNNEVRMQKIYDKTRKMLFNGANKKQSVIEEYSNNITNTKTEINDQNSRAHFKQSTFDKSGTLCLSNKVFLKQPAMKPMCLLCGHSSTLPCGYCESSFCDSCLAVCSICSSSFCSKCNIMSSTDSMARTCLSCCN